MLTIRLSRTGKTKKAYFRLIISEKGRDTHGTFLEELGHYDPHANKAEIKADRVKYWISKGAQTSGTVHNLLVDQKIIEGEKVKVAQIRKKAEEPKAAEAAAAPAAVAKPAEAAPSAKAAEKPAKSAV
ncbi:MAG: 30S ribosomal protein S16 [Patescibacteria group bacterium]